MVQSRGLLISPPTSKHTLHTKKMLEMTTVFKSNSTYRSGHVVMWIPNCSAYLSKQTLHTEIKSIKNN